MRRLLVVYLLCLMTAIPLSAQDDDSYTIALQRIEEARETNATLLDLSGLNLTELPPEIGQLNNLRLLYLGSNQLSTLPPEIEQLNHLEELYLSNNQLMTFPLEIIKLSNLQDLAFDRNRLTALPSEIEKLSKLQTLYLTDNELTALPSEIGQLSNLQWLYVVGNELTTLPSEIGQLSNLCKLHVEDNKLLYLPTSLGNLTTLIPQSDSCMGYYPGLYLEDNPLISPPPEVVGQGTAAVLAYLRNQAWYHTQRLIISAAAGVGLLVLLVLGVHWKQSGGRKPKQKREVISSKL